MAMSSSAVVHANNDDPGMTFFDTPYSDIIATTTASVTNPDRYHQRPSPRRQIGGAKKQPPPATTTTDPTNTADVSDVGTSSTKPYKLLWRYRNKNDRLQWNMYIYVGNVIPAMKRTLQKIAPLSMYDTLTTIDNKERHHLEAAWGPTWFQYLFPSAHIDETFRMLQKNKTRHADVEQRMGAGWITQHREQPVSKRLIYSYSDMIKDDRERRALKKIRTVGDEDETAIDYRLDTGPMDERVRAILGEEQALDLGDQFGGSNTYELTTDASDDQPRTPALDPLDPALWTIAPDPKHRPAPMMDHVKPSSAGLWAYVCLVMLGDAYVPGALATGSSIKNTGSPHAVVCMVTPDVSDDARRRLRCVFDDVIEVPYLTYETNPLPGKKQRAIYAAWTDHSFTKWNMLNLIQYEKTLFIDSDKIVLRNIDHLFAMSAPAATFTHPLLEPFSRCNKITLEKCRSKGGVRSVTGSVARGKHGMTNPYVQCHHGSRVTSHMVHIALGTGIRSMVAIATCMLLSPNAEDYAQFKAMVTRLQPFGFPNNYSAIDEQSITYYFSIYKNQLIETGLYGQLTAPAQQQQQQSSARSEWTFIDQTYNYIPWKRFWLNDKRMIPSLYHFVGFKPWNMFCHEFHDLQVWWKTVHALLHDDRLTAAERDDLKQVFDADKLADVCATGCNWCHNSIKLGVYPDSTDWKHHDTIDDSGCLSCPRLLGSYHGHPARPPVQQHGGGGHQPATTDSDDDGADDCAKFDDTSRQLLHRIGIPDWELRRSSSMRGADMMSADDDIDAAYNDDDADDFTSGIIIQDDNATDEEPLATDGANIFDDETDHEYEEIEKLYRDDIDDSIGVTNKLLNTILEEESSKLIGVPFDTSANDVNYDTQLSDIYTKNFVYSDFIYGNDTVKTIRQKICSTLQQDPYIDKAGWILPSRQYLWCEYTLNNKNESVMIGQKWIKRTELLQIDTVPSSKMHLYERLYGSLRNLQESVRKYGNKIRRDDDDNLILDEYEPYMQNREIYMIDLYHEFGKNYTVESEMLRNVYDVYVRIYFSRIRIDEIRNIIDYLSDKPSTSSEIEHLKIQQTHNQLLGDMRMEHEIMEYVDNVRNRERKKFEKFFTDRYITQSVIHVNLYEEGASTLTHKLDLYRIFDSFIVNDKYPFAQRQMMENEKTWMFHEETVYKKENLATTMRWFENAPHGLSFKIKISDDDATKGPSKYISINLTDTGRIEYKTQWREEDMATVVNIDRTYEYVKDLIRKINAENYTARHNIRIPVNDEFRYMFINTIQKFKLPGEATIDHNDLSDFARYFFPYVALQVEPRKRQSKMLRSSDKGKYGTYLRYKRVSRYDNQLRMEHRIMYFMRNYDYTDANLSTEIAKQFNITEARASDEIDRVRKKYPALRRSRKIMKKLENIPKYKPPGIEIAIQGKLHENYKIRISGAKDQVQTNDIVDFMNIVIYLYYETYILKRPERQIIKEKLCTLTDIARRRNRVEEFVRPSMDSTNIKQVTQMDRKRLAYTPEEGENQWSRLCQNSGDDKKRQPQIHTSRDAVYQAGYRQDDATGDWMKSAKVGKRTVRLRAIRLMDRDESGTHERFYTCNPKDNGEHMYIGFLTRSLNPYGLCMPCCYKKDHAVSKNKEKRDFFKRCLQAGEGEAPLKITGDRLYILQDTNRVQDGRLSFLPRYLDIFFNTLYNRQRKLKNNYLVRTEASGYIFKYGTPQDENPFLNACAVAFGLTLDDIKQRLITMLHGDTDDRIFTSLNNGDIRTQFDTRKKLIDFIDIGTYIDWDIVVDLIAIPGCIDPIGMNIVILEKQVHVIRQSLEREKIREDYYPVCTNSENIRQLYQTDRRTAVLLKEGRHYYPLANVVKPDENSRDIAIDHLFTWSDVDGNLVNQLYKYYKTNCCSETVELLGILQLPTAKKISEIISTVDPIRYQLIDKRNRCRDILTKSGLIIPTRPSGTIWNIPNRSSFHKYTLSMDDTLARYNSLWLAVDKQLPIQITGIYYDESSGDSIHIVSLRLQYGEAVPIVPQMDSRKRIEQVVGLQVQHRPVLDKIDLAIESGKENIDQRIIHIGRDKFDTESYELFRLELSDHLKRHPLVKERLLRILDRGGYDKKVLVRELLLKQVDTELWTLFHNNVRNSADAPKTTETYAEYTIAMDDAESPEDGAVGQTGGARDKLAIIRPPLKNDKLVNYRIDNQRKTCRSLNHASCTANVHCGWIGDRCQYVTTRDHLLEFINRVSEELVDDDLQAMKRLEILQQGDYFVSDIVDYNQYTERPGQRIIRSTSVNISRIFDEVFGRDAVPKLGRRKVIATGEIDYIALNLSNPPRNMGDFIAQTIYPNKNTLYRAYANGFYWFGHCFQESDYRNLGYYSPLQTYLSNYYKNATVQWIRSRNNRHELDTVIFPYIDTWIRTKVPRELALTLAKALDMPTDGWIELYILSKIHDIPIIVYDENNTIKWRFHNGVMPDDETVDPTKCINIMLGFQNQRPVPDTVEVMMFM